MVSLIADFKRIVLDFGPLGNALLDAIVVAREDMVATMAASVRFARILRATQGSLRRWVWDMRTRNGQVDRTSSPPPVVTT